LISELKIGKASKFLWIRLGRRLFKF